MKGKIIKYTVLKKNLKKIPNYNNKIYFKKGNNKMDYLNKDYSFSGGNSNDNLGLMILGMVALIGMIIFIAPWISFWIAYFGGWIAKITIGKYIVNGFTLLGLTMPIDKIPLLAGTFGWIGGFFKSYSLYRNKN